MDTGLINEEIYRNYFGKLPEENNPVIKPPDFNERLYKDHTRMQVANMVSNKEYNQNVLRQTADGNIDDIEQLAEILKRLCNAAWGEGWGELSPDLKKGEDSSKIIMPQITVEINNKEISEGIGGLKPMLIDIIEEETEDGEKTGDSFLIYRQWYDTDVEFNIYGRTNKEARELQKRFEKLLTVYTGYLKRQGISEIIYLKEVSPKFSLNYDEKSSMRSIYYYIRFESITPVRQSVINDINLKIGAKPIKTEKVKTLISSSKNSDPIELDFFDGDNGITYNF